MSEELTRAFGVQAKRTARCDVIQYAIFRVEAVSEPDARAVAERMIAEEDDEIEWRNVGDFDNEEAGDAAVDWIGEIDDGAQSYTSRNARVIEMLDEVLEAAEYSPGERYRLINVVERELDEIAEAAGAVGHEAESSGEAKEGV